MERKPDPGDRRVWLVGVTASGKELVGPISEIDRDLRSALRAGISRDERQLLAGLLLRLQSNLERVTAGERR